MPALYIPGEREFSVVKENKRKKKKTNFPCVLSGINVYLDNDAERKNKKSRRLSVSRGVTHVAGMLTLLLFGIDIREDRKPRD